MKMLVSGDVTEFFGVVLGISGHFERIPVVETEYQGDPGQEGQTSSHPE